MYWVLCSCTLPPWLHVASAELQAETAALLEEALDAMHAVMCSISDNKPPYKETLVFMKLLPIWPAMHCTGNPSAKLVMNLLEPLQVLRKHDSSGVLHGNWYTLLEWREFFPSGGTPHLILNNCCFSGTRYWNHLVSWELAWILCYLKGKRTGRLRCRNSYGLLLL